MNINEEYALGLQKRFGLAKVGIDKLTWQEKTCYEVAKAVLPKPQLIQWLKEETVATEELRKEFNKQPYDKFTAETLALIALAESEE